jgi:ferredoxin
VLKLFKYGPRKRTVRFMVWLSWPLMTLARKLSAAPVFKWIINPFFKRPYNEVTSIPINLEARLPESVPLPRRVVERLVSEVDDKFILHECICREHDQVASPSRGIGCMALGPAINRMHPTNGRRATSEEAIEHVRRAAKAGLVANVAHVWIDPVAFGTRFRDLMFICFCDDESCLYRTHMKRRGPNLDGAYEKLPGISIDFDVSKCDGCGICIERCFVGAIDVVDGRAISDENCTGCGRCVETCPQDAGVVHLEDEDALFQQLRNRISAVSELPFNTDRDREDGLSRTCQSTDTRLID